MKYKVGDKVRVKSWDELLKGGCIDDDYGDICFDVSVSIEDFTEDMKDFCGKEFTICDIVPTGYKLAGDSTRWTFTDFMFEDSSNTIRIKYHVPDMTKLENVGGDKSNWIDLRTAEDVWIEEGEYKLISLGVSMQLPKGYEAHIVPRSSTFKNFGIIQTNHCGIVDETYCGDNDVWMFPAFCLDSKEVSYVAEDDEGNPVVYRVNVEEWDELTSKLSPSEFFSGQYGTFIPKDTRICQFRLFEHQPEIVFEETDSLGNDDRGGIGSTGTK